MSITVPTRYSKDQLFAALQVDECNLGKNTLKKAEEGKDSAFYEIGQTYLLRKDNEKALGWFVMAAEKYHAGAFCKLGNMFQKGTSVKANYQTAMDFYLMAAKRGDRSAYGSISTMFGKGLGVQLDKRLEAEWRIRCESNAGIFLTYSKYEILKLGQTYILKSVDELLIETKVAIKEHHNKEQMQSDIERLQLEKKEMKDEIQLLKEKNQTLEQRMQVMSLTFQEEMKSIHDRVKALELGSNTLSMSMPPTGDKSLLESHSMGIDKHLNQKKGGINRKFEPFSRNFSIALTSEKSTLTGTADNSRNNIVSECNNDFNYDTDVSIEEEDDTNKDLNYDGK